MYEKCDNNLLTCTAIAYIINTTDIFTAMDTDYMAIATILQRLPLLLREALMFKMFRKAGDSMRKFLLTSGEDVYKNDEYYDEEETYYEDQYESDPMQDHYSRPAADSRRTSDRAAGRRSFSSKAAEIGYGTSYSASSTGYQQNHAVATPAIPAAIPAAVIAHPKDIKDATKICDDICSGRMVIVDLSKLDSSTAQRIADYLGGVVHTLQGNTSRINQGIFAISPKDFEVSSHNGEGPIKPYESLRAVK